MNKEQLLAQMRDPKFYLEHFVKIKTKDKGLQPFVLNEAQKDLYNTLSENQRVIILKARQLGFSTAVTGYFYHKTITTPGCNTALIGYNTELVTELLDKVKTFYRTTPDALRPTIHYNSKYEISFPKIDSKIMVLPSTENVGRGYTLNYVLATEVAFWEKAEEYNKTTQCMLDKWDVNCTPYPQVIGSALSLQREYEFQTAENHGKPVLFCHFLFYHIYRRAKKEESFIQNKRSEKKLPEDLLSGSFWFQPRIKLFLHP